MAVVTLTGYKLFRHTADISGQSYTWCAANATLIYDGPLLIFADTGLSSATPYYYKLFAVYEVDGSVFYSEGVHASAETESAVTPYQEWEYHTDSPVLTADYPYQFVCTSPGGARNLLVSKGPIYKWDVKLRSAGEALAYGGWGGAWTLYSSHPAGTSTNFHKDMLSYTPAEANADIYTTSALNSVAFAKTTP